MVYRVQPGRAFETLRQTNPMFPPASCKGRPMGTATLAPGKPVHLAASARGSALRRVDSAGGRRRGPGGRSELNEGGPRPRNPWIRVAPHSEFIAFGGLGR